MIKLGIFDGDNTIWNTEMIHDNPGDLTKLRVFPDTLKTLHVLPFPLALVTMGNRLHQRQKVKILGLEKVFAECVYCEWAREKGLAFAGLMSIYQCSPEEVLVVGDRIDNEIFFGNELGCVTVQIEYGKYRDVLARNPAERPMYRIKSLGELLPLVSSLNVRA